MLDVGGEAHTRLPEPARESPAHPRPRSVAELGGADDQAGLTRRRHARADRPPDAERAAQTHHRSISVDLHHVDVRVEQQPVVRELREEREDVVGCGGHECDGFDLARGFAHRRNVTLAP
jgi:hypothetical protein